MNLLLITIWILSEAIYEALYDNGKKTISGIIEFISRTLGVFTVVYITYNFIIYNNTFPVWKIILGYLFVRFLLFDYIYNLVRGLEFEYLGTTKIYDKLLQKVPWHYLLFIKAILGIIGTCFLLGLS